MSKQYPEGDLFQTGILFLANRMASMFYRFILFYAEDIIEYSMRTVGI